MKNKLYHWLYLFSGRALQLGMFIGQLFNAKIRKGFEGRLGTSVIIKKFKNTNSKPIVWMHCSSLGEFEQGLPVIQGLNKKNEYAVLVSFFSPSGYEYKYNHPDIDCAVYLPFDIKNDVKSFLDTVEPSLFLLVKYDFWYHLLSQIQQAKIPSYLISAHFRKNQWFFNTNTNNFMLKLISGFNHVFVQTKEDAKLLNENGIDNCSISGDTRLDNVFKMQQNISAFEGIERFKANDNLLVCGSTWPEDEKIILEWLKNTQLPNWKLLIAPHDVSEGHVKNLKEMFFNFSPVLYTSDDKKEFNSQVYILDTIGKLRDTYQYADLSYVGGAQTQNGLHNILEPLAYGKAVSFGKNHSKQPEATVVLDKKIATYVSNWQDLDNFLKQFKELSHTFVQDNQGATAIVVQKIQTDHAI